jgi:hypothetical protein
MGILAPFYLVGLAALALPILLHLVRRTPRGQQLFSSLMFLSPTPPRLTRRSRLDQILLLLMRLAALALLAFAFARPFLRESAMLSLDSLPSRQVAILIDTSASLRRGNLWPQAVKLVEHEIEQLGPHDDVALYAFDDRLRRIVDFDKPDAPSTDAKPEIVRRSVAELSPSWAGTDLARALVGVAADFTNSLELSQSAAEPEIILVSDLQQGSRLDDLQGYEWPTRVRVVSRPVTITQTTNAQARVLPNEEDLEDADPRVRVVSAADSTSDQFSVQWGTAEKSAAETAIYVPPGQSRVVRLPRGESALAADRITLRGDDHEFDNTFYVVPPRKEVVDLLYVGDDEPADAQGVQYYLRLAVADDPLREVRIVSYDPELGMPAARLIVASRALAADVQSQMMDAVAQGSTLLYVPADENAATTIPTYFDDVTLKPSAASVGEDDYALLGEIDFTHPLFAPFASPRYSDFTKIHFWKHWPLSLNENSATRVVAQFDDGDPAILERRQGQGRIVALATSWRPDDSQLALSSKFVPLMGALLNSAYGQSVALPDVFVHDEVPLPKERAAAELIVHRPDGKDATLPGDATAYAQTDLPGIYRIQSGDEDFAFAVNVPATESETSPLEVEQLEQLGVRFGHDQTKAERLDQIRQQRDTELEGRQKIWRWMIVLALAILVVETWWAGRAQRRILRPTEAVS